MEQKEQIKQPTAKKKKRKFLALNNQINLTINELNNSSQTTMPKKLLIFDLNRVVMHRKELTSHFHLRPYALPFIKGLSLKFTVALWSSMKRKTAKKMKTFFSSLNETAPNNQMFLFEWYQNKCVCVPNLANPDDEMPILSKNLAQVWTEYPQYNQYNTVYLQQTLVANLSSITLLSSTCLLTLCRSYWTTRPRSALLTPLTHWYTLTPTTPR